jgi:DNA-binding NtrC family response regulator
MRRRELPPSLLRQPLCVQAFTSSLPADTRPTVLLVDDAQDVLVTLGAFLEGAGLRVIKTRSGDEALRVVASDIVLHAIVTDNAMPGLSGVELLLQSAQLRPALPGLIVTGYSDPKMLGELPASVQVLGKPFRREDLVNRVQYMTQLARSATQEPAVAGKPLG